MTQREFFTAVINANVSEELTKYAEHAIEGIDKKNAKRSSKPSKTSIENMPIKDSIVEFLRNEDDYKTATEIGVAVGITTQKASALASDLAKSGTVVSTIVSTKDSKGKKVKRKGYKISSDTDTDEE